MHTVDIDLDFLSASPKNPNTMRSARYESLKEAILLEGFQVPILVREAADCGYDISGTHEIIDGHHRTRAVDELSTAGALPRTIPALVVKADDTKAKRMAIAMARLRGEPNLGVVMELVSELAKTMAEDDIGNYVGYSEEAIAEIIAMAEEVEAEAPELELDDLQTPPPAEEPRTRPWELILTFSDRKQYQKARRALRKAAGPDSTFEDGLLRLIEG